MWKWHPVTRWGVMVGLWIAWYTLMGPLVFHGRPWFIVDLIRPWFILQAPVLHPILFLWLGAGWGVIQDAMMGLPIGINAIAWPTEVLIILWLRTRFNVQNVLGLGVTILTVEGVHHGVVAALAILFKYPWKPSLSWILADSLAAFIIVWVYLRWNERSRLEYAVRAAAGF